MKEALPGAVGLNPFAINHYLWDGTLASPPDDFFGSAGGGLDVDLGEDKVVTVEKAPGFAAVRAPQGGVEGDVSRFQGFKVIRQMILTARGSRNRS